MVLFGKGFEFMSRYQFQWLGKCRIMVTHGLDSFLFSMVCGDFIVTKQEGFQACLFVP